MDMNGDEVRNFVKVEWVALALAEGMTPKLFQTLIEFFGSAEDALSADVEELTSVSCSKEVAMSIKKQNERLHEIEAMLEWLNQNGVMVLTLNDEQYPTNLRLIEDAPPVIFVRGQLLPNDVRSIAIVGSRAATPRGLELAKEMAFAFAKEGWTVVSGLAVGVDTEAHIGAIEAGGRTIAALGSGILVPENPDLASKIETSGALISELPPSVGVSVKNWLRRNRIVTGLSIGTLMIEGAEKSGSVHAATTALKQQRLLFVVAWDDEHPLHIGNKKLAQKATLTIPPDKNFAKEILRVVEQHLPSIHPQS
jgi:DNA processing protein